MNKYCTYVNSRFYIRWNESISGCKLNEQIFSISEINGEECHISFEEITSNLNVISQIKSTFNCSDSEITMIKKYIKSFTMDVREFFNMREYA